MLEIFHMISNIYVDLLLILVSRYKKFKSNLKPRQALLGVMVSEPIRGPRFDFITFSTSYMAWTHGLKPPICI